MKHDEPNIMVILSSPSGVGKTTITKKCNKNINLSQFQFRTQHGHLDQTKSTELIIILFQPINSKK